LSLLDPQGITHLQSYLNISC